MDGSVSSCKHVGQSKISIEINLVLHHPCCAGIHASGMYDDAYPDGVVIGDPLHANACARTTPTRRLRTGSHTGHVPRIDITATGPAPQRHARTVLRHGYGNHATTTATGQKIVLLQVAMYLYFTASLSILRLAELQQTLDKSTTFYE
jgi:hypothetical protein